MRILDNIRAFSQRRHRRPGRGLGANDFFNWLLGCAVAIELARTNNFARIILLSPFTSLPAVAAKLYWWAPGRLILRPTYDNLAKAPEVTEPVLVIAGERDRLVPASFSRQLSEALPNSQFVLVPGAGHNSLTSIGFEQVNLAVRKFSQ